jgi:hypothetical protein
MHQQRTVWHQLFLILIIVCACAGIILQFLTFIPLLLGQGKTGSESIIQVCSYFTITTNVLLAVTTIIAFLLPHTSWGRWTTKDKTIAAITVYIIIVGLVFNIVLRPLLHFYGWARVGNELVHSVVPIFYITYWITFTAKGNLSWKDAYSWLAYPLLYLLYTFIHGMTSGWYPYPFMDVKQIGYTGFWLNSFYLTLLFMLLSFLLIGIDKMIARRKTTGRFGLTA